MTYKPTYFFLASGLSLLSFLLLFNNFKVLQTPIVVESSEHTTEMIVKPPSRRISLEHEEVLLFISAVALQGITCRVVLGRFRFRPSLFPLLFNIGLFGAIYSNCRIRNPFYSGTTNLHGTEVKDPTNDDVILEKKLTWKQKLKGQSYF